MNELQSDHAARRVKNVDDRTFTFTEYKGSTDIPVTSETSSLKVEGGMVRVPSGPGFGVTIDPAFVREAARVTT